MSLFWSIIDFLKGTTSFFIVFNIIVAIVLLIPGLILISKKNREQKTKKVVGMVCLSISLLAFLGALSNTLSSYIAF
jgi:asparagine N-glycosylation enzyme membrane subunit Stt3